MWLGLAYDEINVLFSPTGIGADIPCKLSTCHVHMVAHLSAVGPIALRIDNHKTSPFWKARNYFRRNLSDMNFSPQAVSRGPRTGAHQSAVCV